MHPGIGGDSDYFILSDTDEDDDSSDEVTGVEEEEESVKEKSVEGIQLVDTESKNKITTVTNQRPSMKINVAIKKTVQVAPLKKLDQRQKQNAIIGTTESVRELKERSDTDMESAARKQCSSGLTKSVPPPLMKRNVATKRVQVAPQKQLHSDCSPQKQSNCGAITRPIVQKTTQSSAVARPMQKETRSIGDMKRFESSKRKFEERFAEQKEAKRKIIMVDFHHMPKPANDPRPPKRCWARRRFR